VQVTIEIFWARSGQEMGKKRARTFTNFDRGTVDFWHMGVQVSRINTEVYGESSENLIFYGESVLETNDSDRMAMGAATTMMVAAGSLSGQWRCYSIDVICHAHCNAGSTNSYWYY